MTQDKYPPPIPLPTPEHQHKITRQKWREIITVVLLIVAGVGFLYWRSYREEHRPDAAEDISVSIELLKAAGWSDAIESPIMNRTCWTMTRDMAGFKGHVELIGERREGPLETAIVWLAPDPSAEEPHDLQEAVNTTGAVAQALVRASQLAFETAAKTMEFVTNTPRPHDKGVAGTDNGWKLSYFTYRSYEELGPLQPMICLVLQRLSAGENEQLAEFNRRLFESIQAGEIATEALRRSPEAQAAS